MAHEKYSLTDAHDQLVTGKLLYASAATYGPDWRGYAHTHYFTEIFYIVDGEGHFWVEGEKLDVSRDDLLVVNPNIQHSEVSSENSPLSYIVIGVERLAFHFGGGQGEYAKLCCATLQSAPLAIMRTILDQMQARGPYYEQYCQRLFDVLLIDLVRELDLGVGPIYMEDIPDACRKAKRYIDNHLYEKITLDRLAELTRLNKYYLAHSFADAYNVSPINYLNQQRILCSKEQLASTNLSVAQIAQIVGFPSQSYFSQAFKKATGFSPLEYRSNHKKSK